MLPQTNVMEYFVSTDERNTQKCVYMKRPEDSREKVSYFQSQILLSSDTYVRPKLRRVDACLGKETIQVQYQSSGNQRPCRFPLPQGDGGRSPPCHQPE